MSASITGVPDTGVRAHLNVFECAHLSCEAPHDELAQFEPPGRHRTPVHLLVRDSDRDQLGGCVVGEGGIVVDVLLLAGRCPRVCGCDGRHLLGLMTARAVAAAGRKGASPHARVFALADQFKIAEKT
jgi:hypothetical protein